MEILLGATVLLLGTTLNSLLRNATSSSDGASHATDTPWKAPHHWAKLCFLMNIDIGNAIHCMIEELIHKKLYMDIKRIIHSTQHRTGKLHNSLLMPRYPLILAALNAVHVSHCLTHLGTIYCFMESWECMHFGVPKLVLRPWGWGLFLTASDSSRTFSQLQTPANWALLFQYSHQSRCAQGQ
jgi:hypothetical protein